VCASTTLATSTQSLRRVAGQASSLAAFAAVGPSRRAAGWVNSAPIAEAPIADYSIAEDPGPTGLPATKEQVRQKVPVLPRHRAVRNPYLALLCPCTKTLPPKLGRCGARDGRTGDMQTRRGVLFDTLARIYSELARAPSHYLGSWTPDLCEPLVLTVDSF